MDYLDDIHVYDPTPMSFTALDPDCLRAWWITLPSVFTHFCSALLVKVITHKETAAGGGGGGVTMCMVSA